MHPQIAAVEEWIFGGQPVLWMERYITPGRTDFFNFFYANFYLVAPSVFLVLWFSGRREEARTALLGVDALLLLGLRAVRAAARGAAAAVLRSLGLFTKSLRGGPITHFQEALFAMMPNHAARGAFPEPARGRELPQPVLRAQVLPWFFPFLLVFVVGLLVSTVYLRHHWVVDLLAGAALVPWVLWLTPRFERFWGARLAKWTDTDVRRHGLTGRVRRRHRPPATVRARLLRGSVYGSQPRASVVGPGD